MILRRRDGRQSYAGSIQDLDGGKKDFESSNYQNKTPRQAWPEPEGRLIEAFGEDERMRKMGSSRVDASRLTIPKTANK